MKKIENKRVFLPNFFTVVNMFCGFFAITETIQKNYIVACWLVLAAAVFDALDGKIARFTNTKSKFGVEFDSLADLISFGVVPSVLIYNLYFNSLGMLGILLTFLPLACGAFRLARFNITPSVKQKDDFIGLPIPIYAISTLSFVILNYSLWNTMKMGHLFIPMILFLSILMISKIKYEKLPKFKFTRNRKNNIRLLCLFIFFLAIAFFKEIAIFPLVFIFILQGVVKWAIKLFKSEEDKEVVDFLDL